MIRLPSKTNVFLARFVRANRGDFANQAGVLAGLRRSPQVDKVYVSTFYPKHFEAFEDVVPVTPAGLRGYSTSRHELPILQQRVPVYWGGGVDLQDSGSKIKIALLLLRILLLKRKGSSFVLAFQGAGPIKTSVGRILLKLVSHCIDFAVVREPTAQRLLLEVAKLPADKVSLSVDSALLLDPPSASFGRRYLQERGFDPAKPVLGVNLRRWFHQRSGWLPTEFHRKNRPTLGEDRMKVLIGEIAEAVEKLGVYGQVLFVPMYRRYPEMWEDDCILLERLQALLPENYRFGMVEEDLSAFDLLSVFSMLDVMIGVRLHSTILAHLGGVPAVHIAYEHKE